MGLIKMLFGSSTTDNNKKQFDYSKLEKMGYSSKPKTVQDIVEEIHHSFNSAADRALEEAKKILEQCVVDNEADILEKCGFTSTEKVAKNRVVKGRLIDSEREAKIIQYYQQRYPLYKFIMEKHVEEICKKYGLVHGPVHKYKGDVPSKNIQEIARFNKNLIDVKDRQYIRKELRVWTIETESKVDHSSYEWYLRNCKENGVTNVSYTVCQNDKFSICAPVKDMDMTRSEVVGYKVVDIPDPVVLYPVQFGYFIVSAWGPEASDEHVVNQKMN